MTRHFRVTLDLDGLDSEIDCTAHYEIDEGEPRSFDCPGSAPHLDVLEVVRDDSSSVVPDAQWAPFEQRIIEAGWQHEEARCQTRE